MRIGIVCPYDWSVPGGVQAHIHDLALELMSRGHEVNVLAPTDPTDTVPEWVTSGGQSIAVSYNGSVARLSFGLSATRKVRAWIRNGKFDVLHVHEPLSPSLSALACWSAKGPVVATFHSSMDRSRILSAGYGLAQSVLEKISARIAVSELARNTVVEHVGGDAVLIPNGVHVPTFDNVAKETIKNSHPTIAFLGRFEEPRKGFEILLDALPPIIDAFPDLEVLVAGPGEIDAIRDKCSAAIFEKLTFLGRVSELEKAQTLARSHVYVAPNTGGESFGIVLLEAMASHTAVVATDLPAFLRVLDYGKAGITFPNSESVALASAVCDLLGSPDRRVEFESAGLARVWNFDWSKVATDLIDVYETVVALAEPVEEDLRGQIIGKFQKDSS